MAYKIPDGRDGAIVIEFMDGLFLVGGKDSSRVDFFDPTDNSWNCMKSMNEERLEPGAAVHNGLLYVIGGQEGSSSAEVYNPKTKTWTMVRHIQLKQLTALFFHANAQMKFI